MNNRIRRIAQSIAGLAVLLLTLLVSCQNPVDSPKAAPSGTVTITLAGAGGAARSIMPSVPSFSRYALTLQKGEITQTQDADGLATDGVTVQLEQGTWSVTVDAFQALDHDGNAATPTQEYKAATATASLTVTAGGSNSVAVQLEPVAADEADTPKGVFVWDITLPDGVNSTTMSLGTVSGLIDLDLTQEANRSSSVEVDSGVYSLTIILGKDGLSTSLIEKVYIYGGLQTTATLDLRDVVFGEEVLIAGTLTITNNDGPESGYVVNAYVSEADANSESSPIGTASIPSIIEGNGAFLLGIPVSAYNALDSGTDSGKKVYIRVAYSSSEITVNSVVTVDNLSLSGATVAITQAAVPGISGQPVDARYFQNDTATALTITATASDYGVLTYQWYSNSANSNSGGIVLASETAASYTPPTTVPGTVYYYVVVTNSVSLAKTATASSGTAAIIVEIPGSLNISIGYNNGTITITGDDGSNVISRSGDLGPASLSLSAEGAFTHITWYVDDVNTDTGASLLLEAAAYTAKTHSVTFTGWRNGSYLSSDPIPFTVEN
jgi:hypothetical protein